MTNEAERLTAVLRAGQRRGPHGNPVSPFERSLPVFRTARRKDPPKTQRILLMEGGSQQLPEMETGPIHKQHQDRVAADSKAPAGVSQGWGSGLPEAMGLVSNLSPCTQAPIRGRKSAVPQTPSLARCTLHAFSARSPKQGGGRAASWEAGLQGCVGWSEGGV